MDPISAPNVPGNCLDICPVVPLYSKYLSQSPILFAEPEANVFEPKKVAPTVESLVLLYNPIVVVAAVPEDFLPLHIIYIIVFELVKVFAGNKNDALFVNAVVPDISEP